MILKLLTLGRLRAEQRSAAQPQILALEKQLFIYKEVLLLGAYLRDDLLCFGIAEQSQYSQSLAAHRVA